MDEEELDDILQVLSNPTRRKILAKLVQETHYPLQLSKELRISQQAITKHLRVLETYGIVECINTRTHAGPPRKLYKTTKHFTVTICVDPKVFETRARESEVIPGLSGEEVKELTESFKIVLHTQNYKDRVRKITALLQKTEDEIEELDQKRAQHLHLKSRMLREAYSLIAELYPDYAHRAVLYVLLDDPNADIISISRTLNMTEREVEQVLEEISDDDILPRKKGRSKVDLVKIKGKVRKGRRT